MMAGLILYLYEQGYRNFLFFVNRGQIVEKTKDNFINQFSSKYLFFFFVMKITKQPLDGSKTNVNLITR
jgi:hypothetical protein